MVGGMVEKTMIDRCVAKRYENYIELARGLKEPLDAKQSRAPENRTLTKHPMRGNVQLKAGK